MKKEYKKDLSIFLIILISFFSINLKGFSFSLFKFNKKNKQQAIEDVNKGYVGTLPDLKEEFKKLTPKTESSGPFKSSIEMEKEKLKKAPIENKQYVNIILKQRKKNEFSTDVYDIYLILLKLQQSSKTDKENIGRFIAKINNLIDNIAYIENKYGNKVEKNYVVYKNLLNLSKLSRNVATLRYEAQTYSKYMLYTTEEGIKYHPDKIKKQMDILDKEIEKSIELIRNLK